MQTGSGKTYTMGTSIRSELLNRRKSSPSGLKPHGALPLTSGMVRSPSSPSPSRPQPGSNSPSPTRLSPTRLSPTRLSPSREQEVAALLAQQQPGEAEGLVLKTLGEVFRRIGAMEGQARCTVRVSLIEVRVRYRRNMVSMWCASV